MIVLHSVEMKLYIWIFLFWLGLASSIPGQVNNAGNTAPGARENESHDFQRLSNDIENLMTANVALQKRIGLLADEIKQLRDEQSKYVKSSSLQEDQKRLLEKIAEVDKKRESDRELILEQLNRLSKLMASAPVHVAPSEHTSNQRDKRDDSGRSGHENRPSERGTYYEIQKGDRLEKIVTQANAELKKRGMKPSLTVQQIQEANDGLKANKIIVGKKIFIPYPEN